jgi:hypothetical protein
MLRAFWASTNILQNPDDLRHWDHLPEDIMTQVLEFINRSSLAALRLTCRSWSSIVGKTVKNVQLR